MPRTHLPAWRSVLAVVAHPDDESFGLGAVLSTFADAGARMSVLCLTRGEASTVRGVPGDLTTLRTNELTAAAAALGLHKVGLMTYPDGRLSEMDLGELADHVVAIARDVDADGLIGFDLTGVTGHADHAYATAATLRAADTLGVGVLGWTVPATVAQQLRDEYGAPFDGHSRQRSISCCPSIARCSSRPSTAMPARPFRAASCGADWSCWATTSISGGCAAALRVRTGPNLERLDRNQRLPAAVALRTRRS